MVPTSRMVSSSAGHRPPRRSSRASSSMWTPFSQRSEGVGDTMHGEYKTPGGKLVVVDFSVAGDALRGVEVSGDFFLYPDEALGAITGALEGAPSGASE